MGTSESVFFVFCFESSLYFLLLSSLVFVLPLCFILSHIDCERELKKL